MNSTLEVQSVFILVLIKYKIQNVTCKNCGNKDSLELLSFTSYFHILFIPFVSEGRQSEVECRSCEKEYNLKIQSERIKEIAK